MGSKTIDAYIAGLEAWQAEVATSVREIVRGAAPEAKEGIKWSQPVWETNGPFCYLKAWKNSVNLGFWRGVELEDAQGLLEGSGKTMRHVKLASIDDIEEDALADFVQQAVGLNLAKGDPTKRG
jgi:hypothetical protein